MGRVDLDFLGTGTAFHTDGRGSQTLLFRPAVDGTTLVDLGPTGPAAMSRYRASTTRLDRWFVTHLHGDHTAGWPFLLLRLALADRRTRPLDVFGPRGLRECLEGLVELCYGELLGPNRLGFEVRYHELEVQDARDLDGAGLSFDTLPMEHHPTSIGYRLRIDGRRIAISGDTRWCDALEQLAGGADLLVVECSSLSPQGLAHISLEELRGRRQRLGDCPIALVHLVDEVALALAADPMPGVVAAHDGMTLPL